VINLTSSQQTELAVGMTYNYYDNYNNGIGRLWMVQHPSSILSLTYDYDGRGNKASETANFYLGAALNNWNFYDYRTIKYSYNALGQVVDTWHADGDYSTTPTHTTVGYDARGLPLAVDWNLHDGGATTLATYTRNVAGGIVTRTSPNSDRTFVYDQLGRVTSDKAVNSGGEVQFRQTLVYGKTGEIESMVSKVAGTASRTFAFSHGRQHQLKTASDNQGYSASFTYSDAGRGSIANVRGGVASAIEEILVIVDRRLQLAALSAGKGQVVQKDWCRFDQVSATVGFDRQVVLLKLEQLVANLELPLCVRFLRFRKRTRHRR